MLNKAVLDLLDLSDEYQDEIVKGYENVCNLVGKLCASLGKIINILGRLVPISEFIQIYIFKSLSKIWFS